MNRLRTIVLLVLAALVVLVGQADRDLLQPDDTREAEVAREMLAGGDWVVPHLAGLPFVEKPSGFPATVAAAYAVAGGPSVVAARLVAAAFALASLVAVFLLGRRVLGAEGGALAAALLAVTARFCRTAHEIILDDALTAALAFALLFAWTALAADDLPAKRRAWTRCALSVGVSFLFKGFVGPALFAAGALTWLAVTRRWGELRPALRPAPMLAFAAPVLLWIVPFVVRAAPELQHRFFVENHLGRAVAAYEGIAKPWHFYIAEVWADFAPVTLLLPFAAVAAWRRRGEAPDRAGLFLAAFIVGPLLLLSLSVAKDSVYLLPAAPAVALLAAWWCERGLSAPGRWTRVATAAAAVSAALGAAATIVATAHLGGDAIVVVAASAAAIAVASVAAVSWRRDDLRTACVSATALCALGWTLWFTGPLSERESGLRCLHAHATALLNAARGREILLYGEKLRDGMRGSVGFYGNRTAVEVADPAELVDRLARDPATVAVVRGRPANPIPASLVDAARARGVALHRDADVPFANGESFSLVRAETPPASK